MIKKLYLMRHAQAEDGPQLDPTRELTKIGKKQAKMMGKWLKRHLDDPPDIIIESNMKRSQQTADRVAKKLGCPIERSFCIDPDAAPESAWKGIKDLGDKAKATAVVAISHGPLVENLMAYLTHGDPKQFNFPHGSVAHIEPDTAIFQWMVTPKLIAKDEDDKELLATEARAFAGAALKTAILSLNEAEAELGESLDRGKKRALSGPLIKKAESLIADRFRAQRKYVMKGLQSLKPVFAEAESTAQEKQHLAALMLSFSYPAFSRIGNTLAAGYHGGAAIAAGQLGSDEGAEGPYERTATEIANGLDKTTLDSLEVALKDSVKWAGLVAAVDEIFKSAVTDRAPMAAATEVSQAIHAGAQETAAAVDASGATVEKRWDPEDDPCDECDENASADWIDAGDDFPSGDDAPPAHPNCRCSVDYRTAS